MYLKELIERLGLIDTEFLVDTDKIILYSVYDTGEIIEMGFLYDNDSVIYRVDIIHGDFKILRSPVPYELIKPILNVLDTDWYKSYKKNGK